ncbi:MAG: sugar phosphate isomerase/epimerase family protein [Armatimonadota bacterium]
MKKGISQLVMRHPDLSQLELFRQAKAWGYDGVEALMYDKGDISMDASDEGLNRAREMAAEAGVEIVSLCPRLDFAWSLTDNDPAVRETGKNVVRALIRCAAGLGVDAFLLVPGRVGPDVSYAAAYDRAGEALADLAPFAEKMRVNIAVENVWNKFLLSPLEAARFLDEIGSKNVGWYFDIGNVVIFGFPEQWIQILGARIKRVHAKDFRRKDYKFVPLLEGDVDWPAVMAALKAIGFDHYLTSEVGGGDEAHPRTAEALDRILNM